jgi:hypothetical protein
MQKQRKLTFKKTFHDHPIKTDIVKGFACDERILSAIERTMDSSLEQSSKSLVVRYDVRFPHGTSIDPSSNKTFKSFQSDFCKHLSRKGLKPKYVAVRECDTSPNPHYHVALMLDGQKTQNPIGHLKKAEETLARKLGMDTTRNYGLIHSCETATSLTPYSVMVKRNESETYNDVFNSLSYLAKVATKPSSNIRELFVSKRS